MSAEYIRGHSTADRRAVVHDGRSLQMSKALLILDLDETLVHSTERPLARHADFILGELRVHRRSFLGEFVDAALSWFDVAVWSSGSAAYVHAVVERIFPSSTGLRFVWSRERCTRRLDADSQEYYWAKNLDKGRRAGFPLSRVIAIDDSAEAFASHYGNHIGIQPYTGQEGDTDLQRVLPFLDWLRTVENVRAVDKRRWRSFDNTGGYVT